VTPLPHSLRELLADRLDYAGLFPPAGLPMELAFRNYVAYRHHQHSWLLGRFVCPAGRLSELSELIAQWPDESPLRLSVVGRPSTSADHTPRITADLGMVNTLQVHHRERVQIESFETSLAPESVLASEPQLTAFLRDVREQVDAAGLRWSTVFLEVPLVPVLAAVIAGAARACVLSSDVHLQFGLKLRFGGAEPTATPTATEVACWIVACRDAGCVWKATAGLHQPLAGRNDSLQTRWFGFLSLFAAVVLADVHNLAVPQIESILTESQAKAENFRFDETSFTWRDLAVSSTQIAAARRRGLRSFGSCSFEEPVAGLVWPANV
jgi:hypothetical protein